MIILGGIETGHMGYSSGSTVETWQYGANSAGGVSVRICYKNDTEKTIKYAKFIVVPYNAVQDQVSCSISRISEKYLSITGPIAPNAQNRPYWENCWYNNTICTVVLTKIELEYMDGSKETLKGSDIRYGEIPKPAGCYVATAVYGSYNCPQVWTLRRFRDDTLAGTWYGRAFIRAYYAVSPTLVRWFGETRWFQRLWRGPLDRLVDRLRSQGVEDTPYRDRDW